MGEVKSHVFDDHLEGHSISIQGHNIQNDKDNQRVPKKKLRIDFPKMKSLKQVHFWKISSQ